eukprot:13084973-Alexandrium_andersonii.AAC.1
MRLFEEWGWPPDLKVWRQPHIPKDETDVPKVGAFAPWPLRLCVCVRGIASERTNSRVGSCRACLRAWRA